MGMGKISFHIAAKFGHVTTQIPFNERKPMKKRVSKKGLQEPKKSFACRTSAHGSCPMKHCICECHVFGI